MQPKLTNGNASKIGKEEMITFLLLLSLDVLWLNFLSTS